MKGWIALGGLGLATALVAQTAAGPRARLASAKAQAAGATQRSAQLEAQARAARDDAERTRVAQAAVAARIQAAEAEIAAAEARLAIARNALRTQERRLAAKQQPVMQVLAALQTMARRPAAAALVQPGSLTDLVHVRALLATMAPRLARQTAGLRAEVARARQLRREAALALAAVRDGQGKAQAEQQQLARLELEQRRRSSAFAGTARLEAERAAAIAENSRELTDLVRQLGRESGLRDRLASLPGPLPRPARVVETLPTDAQSAAGTTISYRLPVLGRIVRGFGEALPSGARSRGVSIEARPGALVVAPAAGRVTFAGLFRGYGAIAIVDHGDGYTSLVTGLGSNIARVGDTVAQGGPLGRAGSGGVSLELRKDGQAFDFTTLIG